MDADEPAHRREADEPAPGRAPDETAHGRAPEGPAHGRVPDEPAPLRRRPAAQAALERDRRRRQFLRAAVTGLVAGALAILFKAAVVRAHLFGDAVAAATTRWGAAGVLALVAVTAALGSAAAWATGRFAPEAGGSGIPHVKAVLLHARPMRPVRLLLVKFGCGFAALAAGMSLGREGPTVQMGAAVGKLVGQVLRVRRRSLPALIAAGAGAGLAAAFNAPLAGFLFVMEELKREMSTITYGTALVGSVCAVAVSRMLTGQGPSFQLESASPVALRVLPLVALFGALAGLVGVLFNNALVAAVTVRERHRIPRAAAGAAIGGLAGLMMILLPEATGVGHDVAQRLLAGQFTHFTHFTQPQFAQFTQFDARHLVGAALLVCGAKFALTVLSYGTGVPGGIFAPLLVIGAFLGYACGALLQQAFPTLPIVPVVFATIGMSAVLAGSVRAPP